VAAMEARPARAAMATEGEAAEKKGIKKNSREKGRTPGLFLILAYGPVMLV